MLTRLPDSIPAGADLDNYTSTGFTYNTSVSNAGSNYPTASYAGILIVFVTGTSMYQLWIQRSSQIMYIRTYTSGGGWSDWTANG